MQNHFIKITNISENDLLNAVSDLANLYSSTNYTKRISIYRRKEASEIHALIFDIAPDFEHFCFFVNYMRYPESPKHINPKVKGYIYKDLINNSKNFKNGDWFLVFVPEDDTEYDCVNLINQNNESYKYDFGGRITALPNIEFKLELFNENDYHFITDIISEKDLLNSIEQPKPWWKFW